MAKTKEILRRTKSIASTKKITKAMEVVAAAKMRKAIEAVLKTRTYANLSWETVLHLATLEKNRTESWHPLLRPRRQIKRVAIILITSNRGMCGSYNSAVIAKAKDSIVRHPRPTDFILVGKKGGAIRRQGFEVVAEFSKSDVITDASEIRPIVKMVLEDYSARKYDKVLVAYTDFINPAKQIPRVKQLIPVEVEAPDEYLGVIGRESKVGLTKEMLEEKMLKHLAGGEYIFEPSAREVLDKMIPRLIETQLYQAFLEANASEHSAGMSAMHQATEAATEMLEELKLFYNKARQAGITNEIAEISAGANALAE
jgi:F-type H+-transporting ATPase subunit gamma